MIQINKRSIGVCILLSIITFGIYGIYWLYLLVKNTRSIQKNTTSCTGEMLCLIFVPFYSLYWWYTRGEKVKQEFSQHNYASTGNGIVYLILAIFGLSIVSMAIMQSDFNSLKSETHSEQRSTKKTYGYLALAGIIGIILAVFMVYCHYNYVSGEQVGDGMMKILPMYENSATVTFFKWCCVLSVAFIMIVPTITLPPVKLPYSSKNSFPTIFASSLLGFLFAGYVVNFIISPFRNLWSTVNFPQVDLSSADLMLKIIYYAGLVMAVPCAVYFLVLAIRSTFAQDSRLAILSVCPVIFLALRLVYYFMLTSAQVNLAGRKLNIVALCLAVLFFLQDAKCWIPASTNKESAKENSKRSKMYYATGFGAIVTLAISQLAGTYLQVFWFINQDDSYLLNAIYITMILFISSRIASVDVDINSSVVDG